MLRISDGRMSGTAGGTIVLHISPESAVKGSPFGIIQDGDYIIVDAEKRVLNVDISDDIIRERWNSKLDIETDTDTVGNVKRPRLAIESSDLRPMSRPRARGYRKLYVQNVNQAHEGVDFDFLTADGGGD